MADGNCAFLGKTENCAQAFNTVGFPLPKMCNPADHYIFTLAVRPGKEAQCREKVDKITAVYRGSDEYTEQQNMIEDLMNNPTSSKFMEKPKKKGSVCAYISSLPLDLSLGESSRQPKETRAPSYWNW